MENKDNKKEIATQHQKDLGQSLTKADYQIVSIGSKTYLKTSTGKLTKEGFAESVGKLASNFTKLDDNFFNLLLDRAKNNGFDDKSLNDAVDLVIDNFHYSEPKIADIISFSPNVELLTYDKVVSLMDKLNRRAFEIYRPIKVPGTNKAMYTTKSNIERFKLIEIKLK